MSKKRQTQLILIKYGRQAIKKGKFEWEKIAEEIRQKELDYNYYESFFILDLNAYDWINGNQKWQTLLSTIKAGIKTQQIIKEMDFYQK